VRGDKGSIHKKEKTQKKSEMKEKFPEFRRATVLIEDNQMPTG
jgi:hypothetical protein